MTDQTTTDPIESEPGSGAGDNVHASDGPEITVTDQINAEHVQLTQGGAGEINATTVEIEQGGAMRIDAEQVHIEQGGAAAVYGDDISLTNSAAGVIRAQTIHADQSAVYAAFCDIAELNESSAGLLVSRQVRSTTIRTGVLLASQVEGRVETVLDTPRALLAGLAAGVGVGLVTLLGSLLRRRR